MHSEKKIRGVQVNATVRSPERLQIAMNGLWQCRLDPENKGMAEGWASSGIWEEFTVQVPGCIQACDEIAANYPSFDGLRNSYLNTFWLEKKFRLPAAGGRKLYWLKFGGIAPAAHIWVNGKYAGFHSHMPVAVKFDVTGLVLPDEINRITVAIVEQNVGLMGGFRGFGFHWSGLYRGVEVEITSAVHWEEVTVCQEENSSYADITAQIHNDTAEEICMIPHIAITAWPKEEDPVIQEKYGALTLKAGEAQTFHVRVDTSNIKRWSCEEPNLYCVSICANVDGHPEDRVVERTGFRTFTAEGAGLYLNGSPILLRGVGHEYFSSTICPLTEDGLIKDRFKAMLEHGFNFCRYHTHIPTDEELNAADEMGILISSEISLVSNFHKTLPFEEGLEVLKEHILQTRNHSSLGIYCLGNEGSQLMVDSQKERWKAETGYRLIKEHAPRHLAMIAFGMQGELPELPNDIESPHLWSDEFQWAYEGLSAVPWKPLELLKGRKPCIIHEYGKFGVWPNPAEEMLYPANGYKADFGDQGQRALEELGLLELESLMIRNSRRLSFLCNRTIMEEARRQEVVNGYVLWTFFRMGGRNAGFIDDMGKWPDNDPVVYRSGCNSPVSLLIDRGFEGHTLYSGGESRIGIYVSNFGSEDLEPVEIRWEFECGEHSISGTVHGKAMKRGRNGFVGNIGLKVPLVTKPVCAELSLQLEQGGAILARNQWPFWIFPREDRRVEQDIVCDFSDKKFESTFKRKFAGVIELEDLNSMVRGCRSWKGCNIADTLNLFVPELLMTDHYGEAAEFCIEKGIPVLMLDNGNFPEEWYIKPFSPELKEKDPTLSYTSFRSGWDRGNLGTLIHENSLLKDFPQEGFCDLQFYSLLQGAASVQMKELEKSLPVARKEVAIRSIAKIRVKPADETVVQDPNAIKVLKKNGVRKMAAQDQLYLVDIATQRGRIVICTLNLFDDAAGEYLARNMMELLAEKEK